MGALYDMASKGRSFLVGAGTNKMNPIHGRDRAHVRQSLRQGGRGPLPLRAELRGIQRGPEQGVGQQLEGERGVASDDVDLQRELIGVGYRRQRPADGLHRLGDGLGIAPAGTWGTWWKERAQSKRDGAPWTTNQSSAATA